MLQRSKNGKNVVSALHARSNFGKLLRRVAEERKSLVIEKRGTPQAILMSIRDYVRLAAPKPEVLRRIGDESVRKGTGKLTSRQIDREIFASHPLKRTPRLSGPPAYGLQRTVFVLALTKPARMYVTQEILTEYRSVLARPALKIARGLQQQLMQLVKKRAQVVRPAYPLEVTSDPEDNKFLECADAARADYLITGNQRHFPRFWKNTKIITSREFVSLVAPHLPI